MAGSVKGRNVKKATAEDLEAQIERLQAELSELLASKDPRPMVGERAPKPRGSKNRASKGQTLEAAKDYGVTDQQLERFIEKLDDQAEKDAKAGRLVRYTGKIEDLFGD